MRSFAEALRARAREAELGADESVADWAELDADESIVGWAEMTATVPRTMDIAAEKTSALPVLAIADKPGRE